MNNQIMELTFSPLVNITKFAQQKVVYTMNNKIVSVGNDNKQW